MTHSHNPIALLLAAAAVFALWVPTLAPGTPALSHLALSRPAPAAVLVAPLA
ncbi:hypothetical protein [Novosphingobium sp.]|uniref:hypothetical protein n=1 Tax=Novosphingobium sp. TaxID=1874826 RepID=UPI0027361B18|nr:hypothetical protein [Novosphingobium sp.]MDP3908289.1 hypothetical protein [Novosphingobium sp.]